MSNQIAAIVLAAGLSTRMGVQKLLLPWGKSTVINTVIEAINSAGINTIIVVTGKDKVEITNLLIDRPVKIVYNNRYHENNMTLSLQKGLKGLPSNISGALIVLGDQPQISPKVITTITDYYHQSNARILIPKYKGKKGHPWLLDHTLWEEILENEHPPFMRDFQNKHKDQIEYIEVDSETILMDIDTPEDYERQNPTQ